MNWLKLAIFTLLATILFILAARGQERPSFLRIVEFTWNQDAHVLSWEANRIEALPNGGARLVEQFRCRIEFERDALICRDQTQTISAAGRQHLEDDLGALADHLLQLSSPVIWGPRAEK